MHPGLAFVAGKVSSQKSDLEPLHEWTTPAPLMDDLLQRRWWTTPFQRLINTNLLNTCSTPTYMAQKHHQNTKNSIVTTQCT
jgi:hypothetical protein